MTVIERLRRERIEADEFAGIMKAETSRARVHRYMRAMRRGAYVPPVFIVRRADELSLWCGVDQVAAAEELGADKVDAWVFDAEYAVEGDEVGALACDLAAAGNDLLRGLRARYAASAGELTDTQADVTLHPAMRARQRDRVAARVRSAGMRAA